MIQTITTMVDIVVVAVDTVAVAVVVVVAAAVAVVVEGTLLDKSSRNMTQAIGKKIRNGQLLNPQIQVPDDLELQLRRQLLRK
jgi:hypothetical protein